MIIRREAGDDGAAIRQVHGAAFARPGTTTPAEVELVEALRSGPAWIARLSFVAAVDGEAIGHVMCSRAWIGDRAALGLAPLGVLPAWQRRGVGAALMRAVVGAADALDEPLIGLLGDPRYYRRFGFVASHRLGVVAPDPGWGDHFQVLPLTTHEPSLAGRFRYAAAFDELG